VTSAPLVVTFDSLNGIAGAIHPAELALWENHAHVIHYA
jgi:hypothetical protein